MERGPGAVQRRPVLLRDVVQQRNRERRRRNRQFRPLHEPGWTLAARSDESRAAESEPRNRPRPSIRGAPAFRAHSNAEWRMVRDLSHLAKQLRHVGPKHVPGAGHLDGRWLVACQKRQEAKPQQRWTESPVHAVRDPTQRRLFVDDARAAMVLSQRSALYG